MFQPVIDKLVGNVDKRDKGLLSFISHRRVYYCIFSVLFQNTSTKGWTKVGLFFLEYRYYNKNWPFVPPTLLARLKSAKKKKTIKKSILDMLLSTINTSTKRRTRKELSKFITSLQYLLKFAPSLGNLKYFSGRENRAFYSTLINCSTETFSRKSIVEFWFDHCFPGSSLNNYKKSSALRFTPIHMFSKSRT